MEPLPPSGWGDVATRQHVDARIDARIERALNRSIRWNVGTMIALAGVATVVARLG